jgi:hypothetical protein
MFGLPWLNQLQSLAQEGNETPHSHAHEYRPPHIHFIFYHWQLRRPLQRVFTTYRRICEWEICPCVE